MLTKQINVVFHVKPTLGTDCLLIVYLYQVWFHLPTF